MKTTDTALPDLQGDTGQAIILNDAELTTVNVPITLNFECQPLKDEELIALDNNIRQIVAKALVL